jgi:hypothetical protein
LHINLRALKMFVCPSTFHRAKDFIHEKSRGLAWQHPFLSLFKMEELLQDSLCVVITISRKTDNIFLIRFA